MLFLFLLAQNLGSVLGLYQPLLVRLIHGRVAPRRHEDIIVAQRVLSVKHMLARACRTCIKRRTVTCRTVIDRSAPASLSLRMCAGRRLPASDARTVTHGRPPATVVGGYGRPLSASHWCCCYMCSPRSTFETSSRSTYNMRLKNR
jgi:hypothetical protein